MDVITIVLIMIGLFIAVGSGIMYWLSQKAWRFKFLLVTNNGRGLQPVKAKRVIDKKNKNHRYFIFKDNSTELPIKEPNGSYNNKPVRVISYGPNGQYVYVDNFKIDKDNYLKYSLEPEERELALWQFNQNQREYSEVDKTQMVVFFGMIALAVIIVIGVIYTVIQFSNNADLFGELSKENGKVTKELNNVAKTLERLTEIQTQALTSDSNTTIVREIS